MSASLFFYLATLIGLTYQAEWSYDDESQWPGICTSGKQQSPINIISQESVVDYHGAHIRGPLVLRGYSNVNLTALNNGHTVQFTMADETSPAPVLSGGPLRGNYTFLQFHLHWLSEHAIDGLKYPLEIHFVHVKTGLTIQQALERPDGLAVLGVLAEVRHSIGSDYALEEVMEVVPRILEQHTTDPNSYMIDITRFLSPDPQSYYTYHGSLTTPNCEEVVTWIVMDNTITMSDTQFKVLSKADVGGIDNYRSLQTTNRVVYHSVTSSCSKVAPTFLAFLASMINCASSNMNSVVKKGACTIGNFKRKVLGQSMKECSRFV